MSVKSWIIQKLSGGSVVPDYPLGGVCRHLVGALYFESRLFGWLLTFSWRWEVAVWNYLFYERGDMRRINWRTNRRFNGEHGVPTPEK